MKAYKFKSKKEKRKIKSSILSTGGSLFSISFVKKDGTTKDMVARTGVTKYSSGTGQCKPDIVEVFDMNGSNFCKINVGRVTRIKFHGIEFNL